jgi:hypothetical protein
MMNKRALSEIKSTDSIDVCSIGELIRIDVHYGDGDQLNRGSCIISLKEARELYKNLGEIIQEASRNSK